MADALRGLGRYEQAAPYWDEIVREDPKNPQVLTRAGDCFFRLGELAKAEQLFHRALALGHDTSAYLGLARLQRHRGEHGLALQSYERILARNPADSRTIALRGETLAEAEGVPAALDYLREQLMLHPEGREIEHSIQRLVERH
jgi:tetratricopeptide (TPR) repeat protein